MQWKWVLGRLGGGVASPDECLCVLECHDKAGALATRLENREAHLAFLKEHGSAVVAAGENEASQSRTWPSLDPRRTVTWPSVPVQHQQKGGLMG